MALYSEIDGRLSGERGECAPINYADEVTGWDSWKDSAICIGPVGVAYEGVNPQFDNVIVFDEPAIIVCGFVQVKRRFMTVDDIDPTNGVVVDHPLVFDAELRAFSQIFDEQEGYPLTHIWVDWANAQALRALRGIVPYLSDSGEVINIDAKNLRTH